MAKETRYFATIGGFFYPPRGEEEEEEEEPQTISNGRARANMTSATAGAGLQNTIVKCRLGGGRLMFMCGEINTETPPSSAFWT